MRANDPVLRGVPSLDAVALAGAGYVVGILPVVVTPLLRWLRRRQQRRFSAEDRRRSLLSVGDAAVAGDGGGHERRVRRNAERLLRELELHGFGTQDVVRFREIERQALRLRRDEARRSVIDSDRRRRSELRRWRWRWRWRCV